MVTQNSRVHSVWARLGSETCVSNGQKKAQAKNTLPACAFLAAAARRASRRLPATTIRTCQMPPNGKDRAVSAWRIVPAADKGELPRLEESGARPNKIKPMPTRGGHVRSRCLAF